LRFAIERRCDVSEQNVEVAISSPPAAAVPVKLQEDPVARLRELARELARVRNRRLLAEYLRLRRSAR
jgi:hypothetical protein